MAALQAVEPRQPGPVALLHSELAGEASAHSGRGLEPQRPFAVLLGRYMCAALRFRLRRALIGPVCHNVRTDPASDVKSAWAEADLAALCHHALRALVDHNDVFEAVLAGDSDSVRELRLPCGICSWQHCPPRNTDVDLATAQPLPPLPPPRPTHTLTNPPTHHCHCTAGLPGTSCVQGQ